jgi:hypothetical protein
VPFPIPDNEIERLGALRRYEILDTPPEAEFDDLARLASGICGTPAAFVTLIDADREFFKAAVGMDVREISRDAAFCAHAILQPAVTVVPDLQVDARFADNPLVRESPAIAFTRARRS